MGERQQKLKETEAWDTQDRISNLPDVLLTHILSFVPTKESVRTSVLSTRWKRLWAYVPVLDLSDLEFLPKGDAFMDRNRRKANFLTFVHRFLMQNNWSSIRKFCLICSECYDFSQIESWIRALKNPNFQELQLTIYTFVAPTSDLPSQIRKSYLSLSYSCLDPHLRQKTSFPTGKFLIEGSYLEDPCILDSLFSLPKEWNVKELEFENCTDRVNWHKTYDFPQRLFTCEMLVVLKLHQCVDFDCPGDRICFPNLKVLHLDDNTFKYHDSASKLINSGCPVLEELDITRGEWDDLQRLVITSHILKRLKLSFLYFDGDGDDLPFETVIDVPALEYLDLQDWTSKKFVLGDFGSLIKARVDLNTDCAAEVFRSIHNVKKLCLLDRLWDFEESLDLPVFHYLTCLKFSSYHCGNSIFWTLILESLSMSPILEKVYFQNVKFVVGEEFDLTSEQDVPHCLLSSLKTCGFGWLNGDKNEVEVIGYFLKNSKVLKCMTISSLNPENINKQAISALSRGSSECKIYYRRN